MYVRIARFEGAEGNWDERIEEVRNRMRSREEGSPMAAARGAVKRAMMLVDRENDRGASYNRMLWTALRKKAAYLPG